MDSRELRDPLSIVFELLPLLDLSNAALCCRTWKLRVQRALANRWAERMVAEELVPVNSHVVTWIRSGQPSAARCQATYCALRIVRAARGGLQGQHLLTPARVLRCGFDEVPSGVLFHMLTDVTGAARPDAAAIWPHLTEQQKKLYLPLAKTLVSDLDHPYLFGGARGESVAVMYNQAVELGWFDLITDKTAALASLFPHLSAASIRRGLASGADITSLPQAYHLAVERPDGAELIPILATYGARVDWQNHEESALELLLRRVTFWEEPGLSLLVAIHQAGVPGLQQRSLELIAAFGTPELVEALHELGLWTPGQVDGKGQTPLHQLNSYNRYATEITVTGPSIEFERTLETARKLVEKGEDINARDPKGQTPLYAQLRCSSIPSLRQLLAFYSGLGADFNALTSAGQTLLHALCARTDTCLANNEDGIRELMRLCPKAMAADQQGRSPLRVLLTEGMSEVQDDEDLQEWVANLKALIQGVGYSEVVRCTPDLTTGERALLAAVVGNVAELRELLITTDASGLCYLVYDSSSSGAEEDNSEEPASSSSSVEADCCSILDVAVAAEQPEAVKVILEATSGHFLESHRTSWACVAYNPADIERSFAIAQNIIAVDLQSGTMRYEVSDFEPFLLNGRADLYFRLVDQLMAGTADFCQHPDALFELVLRQGRTVKPREWSDFTGLVRQLEFHFPSWRPSAKLLTKTEVLDLGFDYIADHHPRWLQDPALPKLLVRLLISNTGKLPAIETALDAVIRCGCNLFGQRWQRLAEKHYGDLPHLARVTGTPLGIMTYLKPSVLSVIVPRLVFSSPTQVILRGFLGDVRHAIFTGRFGLQSLEAVLPTLERVADSSDLPTEVFLEFFGTARPARIENAPISAEEGATTFARLLEYVFAMGRFKDEGLVTNALDRLTSHAARGLVDDQSDDALFVRAILEKLYHFGLIAGLRANGERHALSRALQSGSRLVFDSLIAHGLHWYGMADRMVQEALTSGDFKAVSYWQELEHHGMRKPRLFVALCRAIFNKQVDPASVRRLVTRWFPSVPWSRIVESSEYLRSVDWTPVSGVVLPVPCENKPKRNVAAQVLIELLNGWMGAEDIARAFVGELFGESPLPGVFKQVEDPKQRAELCQACFRGVSADWLEAQGQIVRDNFVCVLLDSLDVVPETATGLLQGMREQALLAMKPDSLGEAAKTNIAWLWRLKEVFGSGIFGRLLDLSVRGRYTIWMLMIGRARTQEELQKVLAEVTRHKLMEALRRPDGWKELYVQLLPHPEEPVVERILIPLWRGTAVYDRPAWLLSELSAEEINELLRLHPHLCADLLDGDAVEAFAIIVRNADPQALNCQLAASPEICARAHRRLFNKLKELGLAEVLAAFADTAKRA